MLKITRKVEYALIALRHMQLKQSEELTSTKEIATRYGVPQQLLAKTLQHMARDGIIEAVQGPAGGYRVATNLEQISMKDFFEKLEGPLGMMDCYFDSDCIQFGSCNIRVPIQRINDNMRNLFSQMSVQEVTQ
ncbi:MAG TPA: Rrf2 family transcriptional regulator [Candidatus Marinimicrobia bacterium]|jgi:Rrf2 family protein|nr:Rrf2 family transcriptional regulator [Candidatus Neomarinimicrobiota bacterium]HIB34676.1 Rrf2 family transcriptional regulator [Candidatus Neomarinimicrobiota bacterium]